MKQNAEKNISELVEQIKQARPKRILLQLPDGLKQYTAEICSNLQNENIECFISASPCYGACCLALHDAEQCKADLLVHIGHNDFGFQSMKKNIPVLFYPWRMPLGFTEVNADKIKENNLALVATVQYLNELSTLAKMLKNKNCTILGQVLGCKIPVIPNSIEAVVYLGSGIFHPTAFTDIPVYTINPINGSIDKIEKNPATEKKKIAAALSKLHDAQHIGILVSSYPGQQKLKQAQNIIKKLKTEKNKHKNYYIIYGNELNADMLENMPIDVFINTACPRIRQDYLGKPVINAEDVNI